MPNKRERFGQVEQRYVPAAPPINSANQPCLITVSGNTIKKLFHVAVSVFIADPTRMHEDIIYRLVVFSGIGIPDLGVAYEPFFAPSVSPDNLKDFNIIFDELITTQGEHFFDFSNPIEAQSGETLGVMATWVYSATGGFAAIGPATIQACLQRLSVYGKEFEADPSAKKLQLR